MLFSNSLLFHFTQELESIFSCSVSGGHRAVLSEALWVVIWDPGYPSPQIPHTKYARPILRKTVSYVVPGRSLYPPL